MIILLDEISISKSCQSFKTISNFCLEGWPELQRCLISFAKILRSCRVTELVAIWPSQTIWKTVLVWSESNPLFYRGLLLPSRRSALMFFWSFALFCIPVNSILTLSMYCLYTVYVRSHSHFSVSTVPVTNSFKIINFNLVWKTFTNSFL